MVKYFGNQIGFYFTFTRLYALWLAVPGLLGIIIENQVYGTSFVNSDAGSGSGSGSSASSTSLYFNTGLAWLAFVYALVLLEAVLGFIAYWKQALKTKVP